MKSKYQRIDKEDLYDDKNGDYGVITEPFDPKQVDIITETMVIANIIDRLHDDRIVLNPDFQRNSNLWDDQKQSRLIESLIVRIPLPSFYFDYDDSNDDYIVVDGLQRLWAIKRFASLDKDDPNRLRLVGMEYLTELNGKLFEELPLLFQRRIKEQSIIAYVIRPGTPEFVRNSIFTRINTGGLQLTPAEIKNSIYRGQAANFVRELAHSQQFVCATNHKIDPSRMMDCEFVNRFLAFYYLSTDDYRDNLESFLNEVLLKLKTESQDSLSKCKEDFYRAMDMAVEIFGDKAFRKILKNHRYGMINKPLFESISVCFAKLDGRQSEELLKNKGIFLDLYEKLFNDAGFVTVITDGTAKKSSIEKRIYYISQIISDILG